MVSAPAAKPRTAILALDYGRERIGMALATPQAGIAQPLGTLERVNRNEDMRRLRELARDLGVKQIVVGLPLRLDGTPGEMAREARRFAERLRKQLGVPVELQDERLTSWEAERILEEEFGKMSRVYDEDRKRRPKMAAAKISVDSVAATVILREYLQQHPEQQAG